MQSQIKSLLKKYGLVEPMIQDLPEDISLIPTVISYVTLRSMDEILQCQELIDKAKDALLHIRRDYNFGLTSVQKEMRAVQKTFLDQDKPVTKAEREYKVDPRHSDLEALQAQFEASIEFCTGYLDLLDDKSLKLSQLIKSSRGDYNAHA